MESPWHVLNREGETLGRFLEEIDARTWAVYYLAQHMHEHVFVACDRAYVERHTHVLRERVYPTDDFWTTERLLLITVAEDALGSVDGQ